MIATVVVPAYNAAATLTKCLDSLSAQEIRPNLKLEIVVVDDGSTDQTATIVRRYQGVRLICRPHRGAATARNVGVRAAAPTCTAILFTDADCMPAPDWAMHLVEALENTGPMVAAVKGIYRSNQCSAVARFVQAEYEERYSRFAQGKAKPGFADTYCAAYHRRILLEYPFDETLPGAIVEDAELGWRLSQAGYTFEFAPQAIVYHHHPTLLKTYFQRKFRIARWRVTIYHRYPGRLPQDGHTSRLAQLQMLLLATVVASVGLTGLLSLKQSRCKPAAARVSSSLLVALQLSFWPFLKRLEGKLVPIGWLLLNLRTLAFSGGAFTGLGQLVLGQLSKKVY